MLGFSNLTIKQKLIWIIMSICSVTLLLTCAVYITYQQYSLRQHRVQNLSVQARIIGDNCKASLSFDAVSDAVDILKALRAESSILFACVYTNEGEVFARYQREDVERQILPPAMKEEGHEFDDHYVHLYKPILLDGERIGMVYLRSDLREMQRLLHRNLQIIVLVLVAAGIVAYILTRRLQRVISKPILCLAQTAQVVSEKKDYSVRADKLGNDEVGVLVDAFNDMLKQIETREAELRESEMKFRTLYESSTDAVVLLDENGFFDFN
ncbi:MAG: HAMP domain-containing protein, partial [Sedimentisphaerales bacterium]|nr:HAMP domain-containing protein [Sedimentisphaerales bacterium]